MEDYRTSFLIFLLAFVFPVMMMYMIEYVAGLHGYYIATDENITDDL